MPHKKYDFTSCVLDGFIYVISGRDYTSEIIESCERYDYAKDVWESISPVKKKRYASSCASLVGQGKIYLFGGRPETNNVMLNEIEEYVASKNTWSIIQLKDPSVWTAVEVSAMAQIDEDRILIFGGSDHRVRDSQSSYIFNTIDYSIEKTDDLKSPQVFVANPVCYGSHVYAVGNEYYVKNRSLNRFNTERLEWSIIF